MSNMQKKSIIIKYSYIKITFMTENLRKIFEYLYPNKKNFK